MGADTPECILGAVFYENPLSLRRQRASGTEDFMVCLPHGYRLLFTQKMGQGGGLHQFRIENKVFPVCASAELGIRCNVHQIRTSAEESVQLRLKLLGNHSHLSLGLCLSPVVEKRLSSTMKLMFVIPGITVKTNHSLQTTESTSGCGTSGTFTSLCMHTMEQETICQVSAC